MNYWNIIISSILKWNSFDTYCSTINWKFLNWLIKRYSHNYDFGMVYHINLIKERLAASVHA